MRAEEFLHERQYMDYVPSKNKPDEAKIPLELAIDRVDQLSKSGEAVTHNHAIKIAAAETANEVDLPEAEVEARIRSALRHS